MLRIQLNQPKPTFEQRLAHEALRLASHKLPVATKFMIKEGLEIGGEETAAAS